MPDIDLIYNSGFPWYAEGNNHVKGYAWTGPESCLRERELLRYFAESEDFMDFLERLDEANGMFSVVISGEGSTWLGVDRMRTFPLFYSLQGNEKVNISDSVDSIIAARGNWSLNKPAGYELLATGYVTGKETLAENIFQVRAAEALEIAASVGQITTRSRLYSSYRTEMSVLDVPSVIRSGNVVRASQEELVEEFEKISLRVFKRLTGSIEGRTAVIALSGGFDSRFVAAMLTKLEYPRILCFSYGRNRNPDLLRAVEVAAKLGLELIPVVYTHDLIHDFQADRGFRDYMRYTTNHVSMFFLQEYFAVKHLKEKSLIPDDSVLIPGHSGDFFGGSQLLRHGLRPGREPLENTVRRLYNIKYAWVTRGAGMRKTMLARLERTVREKNMPWNALSYSIHEDWDLKEKLAKFIVNSCNVYSWFGYEYRLPLYDYELQDFFRDLPYEFKLNKKLYDDFLVKNIFREMGLNFEAELQPDEKTQKRTRWKGRIKRAMPSSLVPTTVSRQDPIFYNEITEILKQDLASRGIHIRIRGNSYNSLIVQWYMEYLKSEFQHSK